MSDEDDDGRDSSMALSDRVAKPVLLMVVMIYGPLCNEGHTVSSVFLPLHKGCTSGGGYTEVNVFSYMHSPQQR